MANPVPVTYNATASPVAGGRYVWPAWRHNLAPGTFTNISNNTFASVRPPSWGTAQEAASPFYNWSGGVYGRAVGGRYGSYLVHGSGHLQVGSVLWAGVWGFDIESGLWAGYNVPPAALQEGITPFNEYAESTDPASLGHTYPPHTYDGLIYQPPELGGGTTGALIRNCLAGASVSGSRCVHRFDLSASNPPVRVIDNLAGVTTSYPMAALDEARGGYWAANYNGIAPLAFVSFAGYTQTTWQIGFGGYGDQNLVYLPAPYDCLVSLGRIGSYGVDFGVFVCPIVNNVPQGWTLVTTSGPLPEDYRCGACWSEVLGCLVMYEAGGSSTIHKMFPPANLTAGTWVITEETLSGAGGATPSNGGIASTGSYSRFIEIPRLRCFVWCGGINAPVQAWLLQEM